MTAADLIIVAIPVVSAVFAGAITYALTGRDLQGRGRVAAALVSAVLVGASSLFLLYLSVAAFLACAVAYLVARRILRPRLALAASGLTLLGGLSGAAVMMSIALSEM
jgi:hypothetical protein